MCRAVYAIGKDLKPLLLLHIHAIYEENDDGYFVAARVKEETKTIRTKDFETFLTFVKKLPVGISAYALHARLAARGQPSVENIHGWLEKGYFVYHNGVLTSCGNHEVSDTIEFARKLKKIDFSTIRQQLFQETGGGAIFFASYDLRHTIIAAIEHPVYVYVSKDYVVYASKPDVHTDLPEEPETLLFHISTTKKFGVLEFISTKQKQVKISPIPEPKLQGDFNDSIVEIKEGIPIRKEVCFTRKIDELYLGKKYPIRNLKYENNKYDFDLEGGDF
jgi:hypothetical protein